MSGQLPSPAPSDRKALPREALSFEDLRAALSQEKIENAKLEGKITELEEKMALLEKQIRDLEAEPWGKKKVRQLKERKRAREEAKAQRAARQRDCGQASAEQPGTAAVEVDVVAEAPDCGVEVVDIPEKPELNDLPVENKEEEKVSEVKPLVTEIIAEPAQAAPEVGAPIPETTGDVDMIDDDIDGGSLFSDDEFDFFAQSADEQNVNSNEADVVPSVEQCSTPMASPTVAKAPLSGGLKAKWTSGMLEMERLQDSERAIRSGNPSPLSAPTSAVPHLYKPFQAFVSNEEALDASKEQVMSLRGGAGELVRERKKRKRGNKAAEAIKEALQEAASTSSKKLHLPLPPMDIEINELDLGPHTSILTKTAEKPPKRKRKTYKGLDKLEAAKVRILDQNPRDTESHKSSPSVASTTSPKHAAPTDVTVFTFQQPSPIRTTFKSPTTSKIDDVPKPASTPDAPSSSKPAKGKQPKEPVLADGEVPADWVPLAVALKNLRKEKEEAARWMQEQKAKEQKGQEQKTSGPSTPKSPKAAAPKGKPLVEEDIIINYGMIQAPKKTSRVSTSGGIGKPTTKGRQSKSPPQPGATSPGWSFAKFIAEQEPELARLTTRFETDKAAADGDVTPGEQLPKWPENPFNLPGFLESGDLARATRDAAAKTNKLQRKTHENLETPGESDTEKEWKLRPWVPTVGGIIKPSPLDTQPPTPPPWTLKHQPPKPSIRRTRYNLRAKPYSVLLIDEKEQEEEQRKIKEGLASPGAEKKLKAMPFSILPKKGPKKVEFVLPGDPVADAELQGDVAAQSDVGTWWPVVNDKDLKKKRKRKSP